MTKKFNQCPVCGSTNRFFEQLAQKVKDKGYGRPEWNFYLDVRQGPVTDKVMEPKVLIGSKLPFYRFATDICADCGCIYAVSIEEGEVEKQLAGGTIN